MFPTCRYCSPSLLRLLSFIILAGVVLVNCGPSTNKPAASTSPYERAAEAFKKGQLDDALGLTDKLARATPPGDSTERARMLRAVVYTGELKAATELAAAYDKGAENSKNPQFQAAYRRLHSDNLSIAARAALNLAETTHQLAPDGVIAKELTLEASFPTTEGPTAIKQLARVLEGGWIESDDQEAAQTDAVRKGIDEALAEVVSGDRAKARHALASGSTKLEGADFAIFLAKELAEGATVFDRHHGRDPQKMLTLCNEGDVAVKAALAQLKDKPDKDLEKEAKKLQDQFKTIRKDK
jgi:hypothetical protein